MEDGIRTLPPLYDSTSEPLPSGELYAGARRLDATEFFHERQREARGRRAGRRWALERATAPQLRNIAEQQTSPEEWGFDDPQNQGAPSKAADLCQMVHRSLGPTPDALAWFREATGDQGAGQLVNDTDFIHGFALGALEVYDGWRHLLAAPAAEAGPSDPGKAWAAEMVRRAKSGDPDPFYKALVALEAVSDLLLGGGEQEYGYCWRLIYGPGEVEWSPPEREDEVPPSHLVAQLQQHLRHLSANLVSIRHWLRTDGPNHKLDLHPDARMPRTTNAISDRPRPGTD